MDNKIEINCLVIETVSWFCTSKVEIHQKQKFDLKQLGKFFSQSASHAFERDEKNKKLEGNKKIRKKREGKERKKRKEDC